MIADDISKDPNNGPRLSTMLDTVEQDSTTLQGLKPWDDYDAHINFDLEDDDSERLLYLDEDLEPTPALLNQPIVPDSETPLTIATSNKDTTTTDDAPTQQPSKMPSGHDTGGSATLHVYPTVYNKLTNDCSPKPNDSLIKMLGVISDLKSPPHDFHLVIPVANSVHPLSTSTVALLVSYDLAKVSHKDLPSLADFVKHHIKDEEMPDSRAMPSTCACTMCSMHLVTLSNRNSTTPHSISSANVVYHLIALDDGTNKATTPDPVLEMLRGTENAAPTVLADGSLSTPNDTAEHRSAGIANDEDSVIIDQSVSTSSNLTWSPPSATSEPSNGNGSDSPSNAVKVSPVTDVEIDDLTSKPINQGASQDGHVVNTGNTQKTHSEDELEYYSPPLSPVSTTDQEKLRQAESDGSMTTTTRNISKEEEANAIHVMSSPCIASSVTVPASNRSHPDGPSNAVLMSTESLDRPQPESPTSIETWYPPPMGGMRQIHPLPPKPVGCELVGGQKDSSFMQVERCSHGSLLAIRPALQQTVFVAPRHIPSIALPAKSSPDTLTCLTEELTSPVSKKRSRGSFGDRTNDETDLTTNARPSKRQNIGHDACKAAVEETEETPDQAQEPSAEPEDSRPTYTHIEVEEIADQMQNCEPIGVQQAMPVPREPILAIQEYQNFMTEQPVSSIECTPTMSTLPIRDQDQIATQESPSQPEPVTNDKGAHGDVIRDDMQRGRTSGREREGNGPSSKSNQLLRDKDHDGLSHSLVRDAQNDSSRYRPYKLEKNPRYYRSYDSAPAVRERRRSRSLDRRSRRWDHWSPERRPSRLPDLYSPVSVDIRWRAREGYGSPRNRKSPSNRDTGRACRPNGPVESHYATQTHSQDGQPEHIGVQPSHDSASSRIDVTRKQSASWNSPHCNAARTPPRHSITIIDNRCEECDPHSTYPDSSINDPDGQPVLTDSSRHDLSLQEAGTSTPLTNSHNDESYSSQIGSNDPLDHTNSSNEESGEQSESIILSSIPPDGHVAIVSPNIESGMSTGDAKTFDDEMDISSTAEADEDEVKSKEIQANVVPAVSSHLRVPSNPEESDLRQVQADHVVSQGNDERCASTDSLLNDDARILPQGTGDAALDSQMTIGQTSFMPENAVTLTCDVHNDETYDNHGVPDAQAILPFTSQQISDQAQVELVRPIWAQTLQEMLDERKAFNPPGLERRHLVSPQMLASPSSNANAASASMATVVDPSSDFAIPCASLRSDKYFSAVPEEHFTPQTKDESSKLDFGEHVESAVFVSDESNTATRLDLMDAERPSTLINANENPQSVAPSRDGTASKPDSPVPNNVPTSESSSIGSSLSRRSASPVRVVQHSPLPVEDEQPESPSCSGSRQHISLWERLGLPRPLIERLSPMMCPGGAQSGCGDRHGYRGANAHNFA